MSLIVQWKEVKGLWSIIDYVARIPNSILGLWKFGFCCIMWYVGVLLLKFFQFNGMWKLMLNEWVCSNQKIWVIMVYSLIIINRGSWFDPLIDPSNVEANPCGSVDWMLVWSAAEVCYYVGSFVIDMYMFCKISLMCWHNMSPVACKLENSSSPTYNLCKAEQAFWKHQVSCCWYFHTMLSVLKDSVENKFSLDVEMWKKFCLAFK